jgi:hypothetical protein
MPIRSIALLVLAFSTVAHSQTLRTVPAIPQAGEQFEIIFEGSWGDSCHPHNPRLLIADRTLFVTLTVQDWNGCLSAVTPFRVSIPVPGLSAGAYHVEIRLDNSDFLEMDIQVAGSLNVITSIWPPFDTNAGNRVIVLKGFFPCDAAGCPPPEVRFGILPAEGVERISESELHALVPLQTNVGRVNVTVRGSTYEYVRINGFTYISLFDYERILIPIFSTSPIPGVFNSLWQSTFSMVNHSGLELQPDIDIFPLESRCAVLPCEMPVPRSRIVSPLIAAPRLDEPYPPARIFYVRRELANLLAFSLRIRDLSRQGESAGTEIPVVREKDLATLVSLLDVPIEPEFRLMLRVYGVDYVGCCSSTVTFYSQSGEVLRTFFMNPQWPNGALGGLVPAPYLREGSRQFPLQPAYAQLPLEQIPELAGHDKIWITVAASTRIWAFVSVTNNETQHVTVITPQ